ncbi:DUF3120 domain-containing protein [Prochlorococcus marinus str. MU1404]|uniref:DUF3120 domain-containing protein n=1 Tax=Prochlorococcus marinus TaxID=1219 RepID=UPI001ADCCA3F|nr:DUF3120 domain-containing protein [Prochlorococcus marinus]MBO8229270.1 DUF3120 domain-containing protein [Prochlorococcus marinus XMU1404]MBW3072352.1 DUF3120 domain-containing protein [Prochlorococcus marinus str. MU1404]MCR8544547.1 DUF3120 domain-containing protein [Prochlorococcus marinus CUG1432]
MKELITKNLEVKDEFNYGLDKASNSYESTLLSRPISLRLWSSFFVILPIFVQAPWVRLEPISALCFTFVILLGAYVLNKKQSNKWFIVSSLLYGVSGSWLGGCLFWGWLSPYPILHIPVEAVVLPLALIGLGTNWKIGSSFYISSLFGTAVTDITIFLIGIMDQWKQVIIADSESAPLILQKTSSNLIQIKSLSIIFLVAFILWFISKEIFDSATINTTYGKALLVSSYVIQTTLIVDGIFIFLAILQPTFSGLV